MVTIGIKKQFVWNGKNMNDVVKNPLFNSKSLLIRAYAAPREYVHSSMTTHYTPESDKAVRLGADDHMSYPSLRMGVRVMQYKETT